MNSIKICDRLKALSAWEFKVPLCYFTKKCHFPSMSPLILILGEQNFSKPLYIYFFFSSNKFGYVSKSSQLKKCWYLFSLPFYTCIISCAYLMVCLFQSIFICTITINPFEIIKERYFIHIVDVEAEAQKIKVLITIYNGAGKSTTLRLCFLPLSSYNLIEDSG